VDITPDGYDNYSIYNNRGDVFSRSKEFSKIEPYTNMIFPVPELLGFNMGRQYQGDRYIFFPYTQFLQNSLAEVEVDIEISANNTDDIRPKIAALPVGLKWTFINQPLSMIKKVSDYVKEQKAIVSADNNDYIFADENDNREDNELATLLKQEIALGNSNANDSNNLAYKEQIDYSKLLKTKVDRNIKTEEKEKKILEENKEYRLKDIISTDTFLLENDLQVTLASLIVPQLSDKLWPSNNCQAKEAFAFVSKLLSDTTVKIKYNNELNLDNSNRLPVYLYFKDKNSQKYKLLNKELLKFGLANIKDCQSAIYCDVDIYKQLQQSYHYAKTNKLGIFSDKCLQDKENNSDNKLSNLAKNLFKGIRLKSNQIINSLGQIVNKPKASIVNDNTDDLNNNSISNNNDSNIENNINNNTDTTNSNSSNDLKNSNDNEINNNTDNTCLDNLLITAVYSTGQDDWIEIYNNCDKDINLAEAGIRIEKAVSTDNPSIMIRFDQADDFTASNTIISAYDNYIISRAAADLNFSVEAVSLRNNFSLGDSGYSLYLAKGPVTNSYDEDIIDLLGYGSALYFRGARAATAIDDYYVLRRKADINSNTFNLYPQHDYVNGNVYNSGHNFQDFILLNTGLRPVEDNNNDNDNNSNSSDDNTDNISDEEINNNNNNNDDEVSTDNICVDELLITAVYSTAQDDYIEIFNNCDQSVDLAEEGIRLEKALSLEDPAIIIRFDELSDYSATSTVVAPYSSYTISRDESSLDISFDAISLRNDFSFSGDAYSLYLAKGPVSELNDDDIIDLLGYGNANYYLGSGPAIYIEDYNLLRRKANINSSASTLTVFQDYSVSGIYDTDNNFADFISIVSGFADENNNNNEGDDNGNDTANDNNNSNTPISLWHLDSCFGDNLADELSADVMVNNWQWTVGDSSCALRANYTDEPLEFLVADGFDSNNMSILWSYRLEEESSRIKLELVIEEGDNLFVTISPYYLDLKMPAHNKVRYNDYSLPLDTNWHNLAFTTDFSKSTINLYLDDVILTSFTLGQRLYDISGFKLIADNSYLQIDEVALFNKALAETELNSLSSPLEPYQAPEFVNSLDLVHSWDFIEGQGNIAYDTINAYNLNIDESYWEAGISDFAIKLNKLSFAVESDLLINNSRKSFSLSFWYQNSVSPNGARGRLMLKKGTDTKLGIKFSPFNSYLYYNNQEISLSKQEINIPNDDNWHFLALTYNPNDYNLKFYLDGAEVYSAKKVWLVDNFDHMEIIQENWDFILDEIKIYEGTLSPQLINDTYQQKYY
jgi:hypothetical protein